MAVASYASHTDVLGTSGYVRDPNSTANAAIIDTLCNVASRLIDEACDPWFFYDDGAYVRWINARGGSQIDTSIPFFCSAGTIDAATVGATTLQYTPSNFAPRPPVANEAMVIDVGSLREVVTPSVVGSISGGKYPLTVPATSSAHGATTVATTLQIKVAYFENMPQAQWIQELDGDGWNPPSNYYLWPNITRRVGAANQTVADTTSTRPWTAIDLPMIPISNTTWLPTTISGKATIGITAHWGWPVVPDQIKDLTCRAVAVGWRRRQAAEGDAGGTAGLPSSSLAAMRAFIQNELKGSIYKPYYV